jgi:hypothetical protein
VAYSDTERIAGETVKNQLRRNFKNSVIFPMRFLGLNKGCTEQLAIEKKFACCKVTTNEVNKVAFEVTSLGK